MDVGAILEHQFPTGVDCVCMYNLEVKLSSWSLCLGFVYFRVSDLFLVGKNDGSVGDHRYFTWY